MSDRGKPRGVKNQATNLKEVNPTSPERLRHTAFEETTKNPKKQDQQTQKQCEEKPDGPKTRPRTTNHFTEKRLDKPAEGTKAKTCSTRKTSMGSATGDDTNTKLKLKPETPKDISKTSPKTTTVKTPKPTLQVHFSEDPTNTELHQAPEIMTHELAAAKPTKAKTRANNATRERTEARPDGAEETPKVRPEDSVDCILKKTLNKLKIKTKERSDAAQVINDFIKHLIKYLKENTVSFKEVGEPLRTGSYYENLKVSCSVLRVSSI